MMIRPVALWYLVLISYKKESLSVDSQSNMINKVFWVLEEGDTHQDGYVLLSRLIPLHRLLTDRRVS